MVIMGILNKTRNRLVLRLTIFLFIITTVKAFVFVPKTRTGIDVSSCNYAAAAAGTCRRMLVVSNDEVESKWECLAGSLALSAKEIITTGNFNTINTPRPEVTWSQSLLSPPQPSPSSGQITSGSSSSSSNILHVVLKSKDDAQTLLQQSNSLQQQITCLGIRISVNTQDGGDSGGGSGSTTTTTTTNNNNIMVAPETARNIGSLLQEILDEYEIVPNICLTVDLPLHLALLQANVLPKTRGNKNYWQVLLPQQQKLFDDTNKDSSSSSTGAARVGAVTSIAAEYLYDWDNPFGGTDPLACPTNKYCVFLSYDDDTQQEVEEERVTTNSNVQAVAFTALLGDDGRYGGGHLDLASSARLAASVTSVISTTYNKNKITTTPTTTTTNNNNNWEDTVRAIVKNYQTRRIDTVNDNGVLRRTYIEFGYK